MANSTSASSSYGNAIFSLFWQGDANAIQSDPDQLRWQLTQLDKPLYAIKRNDHQIGLTTEGIPAVQGEFPLIALVPPLPLEQLVVRLSAQLIAPLTRITPVQWQTGFRQKIL